MSINVGVIDQLSAAVEAAKKANPADLRKLHQQIGDMLKAADAKNSAEARRAAKLQAAIDDPQKHGAVEYAKGCLRRVGLDFAAASDVNKLNSAMTEHKLDTARRIELKRLLGELGVIN